MYLSSTSGWLDITMCIQIVQKHRHLSFCYTLRTPLRYRVSVVFCAHRTEMICNVTVIRLLS